MDYICKGCGTKSHREKLGTYFDPNNAFHNKECMFSFMRSSSRGIVKKREEIRSLVFQRDKKRCQLCGKRKRILAVHHKDFSGDGGTWEYSNNNLDNLMTLCFICHGKIHHHNDAQRKRMKMLYENDKNTP